MDRRPRRKPAPDSAERRTARAPVRRRFDAGDRIAKRLACALSMLLLPGCAAGPAIHVQRDPSVDFGRYRTYAWTQEPPTRNPVLRQNLVAAIDDALAAKGWKPAPDDIADVLLVGNVSSREEATIDYFYEDGGWDGWAWHGHGLRGMQRVGLRVMQVGTLVLDAFDAATRRAVWRGLAQGYVPDSEAGRRRDALVAVHRMLREFPQAGTGR